MADELKQSQLARIVAPAITDVKYAEGMADAFDKINDNFKKIASLPFLQGVQGDSYQLEEYSIWEDDNMGNWILTEDGKVLLNSIFGRDVTVDGNYFEEIKSNIGEELDGVSPIDFFGSGSGKPLHNTLYFYVIKDDANNVIEKQLGQFYYFIDARLKNIGKVYGDETLSVFNDYTGFYQYRYNPKSYDQKYLRIDILPSIYYDRDKNDLCWKFNGNETGISAIGIEGQSGKDADLSIVLVYAGTNEYSAKVEAEFNYLQKDNTEIYWDYDDSKIKEGKAIICCKTTLGDDESYNFAYGELIKSDGVLNAYWNPGTMFSHVINDMKITSYFYDMGENTIPTAPHYLAIPSDSNRITGNNLNAAHVIRNIGTTSGSIGDLEFINTSNAFNTTESQNPKPARVSEIRDIKLSNYNLKVGNDTNVYISNDKVKVGSTSYIGSTGAVINGNLDVKGTGTFNKKITGNSGAHIYGGITVDGLATMNDGAVGKVNEVDNVELGCPIGTVVMWAGRMGEGVTDGDLPHGWLLCDGSRIYLSSLSQPSIPEGFTSINIGGRKFTNTDIGELQKLVNVIGHKWSVNEGEVRLPNLRQRFPLGADNSQSTTFKEQNISDGIEKYYDVTLGSIGGDSKHELTIEEIPSHNHSFYEDLKGKNVGSGSSEGVLNARGDGEFQVGKAFTTDKSGGSDYGTFKHSNVPPFLAINFIIKYK